MYFTWGTLYYNINNKNFRYKPFIFRGKKSENLDESGFSVLTGISQLERDEEWCNEQWPDLPIKPRDVSLSGISDSSQLSFQYKTFISVLFYF
jgi:hypothetical protein